MNIIIYTFVRGKISNLFCYSKNTDNKFFFVLTSENFGMLGFFDCLKIK